MANTRKGERESKDDGNDDDDDVDGDDDYGGNRVDGDWMKERRSTGDERFNKER